MNTNPMSPFRTSFSLCVGISLLTGCVGSVAGPGPGSDDARPPDTTAPIISAGEPSGELSGGTTQTIVRVTTDEAATCMWSTTPDTPYGMMSNRFTTTGGTSHQTWVTGLTDGQSYTYYVRCQDGAGNATSADFVVGFSIGDPDACANGAGNPPLCDFFGWDPGPYPDPTYGSIDGRRWPDSPGGAHLCLWKDDALAAISFTVDDNCALDHDWWVAQAVEYGFKVTWFVITGNVGTSAYWGDWTDFAALAALGHEVQSHTVTHSDNQADADAEYRQSQIDIETNIPGSRCRTLAYPNGTAYPTIASTYFIGARGVTGALNDGHEINFMNVRSLSSFNYDTSHWASISNMFTLDAGHPDSYRAWQCMHFHDVDEVTRAELHQGFEFIRARGQDAWVGLFREVIQYARERNDATVEVQGIAASRIQLNVTDTLDDDLYDYPLTLKVRLDGSWTGATASQGGAPAPVELVTHDGETFALVNVVPDRGPTTLSRVP